MPPTPTSDPHHRPPLLEFDQASVVRGEHQVLHALSLRIDLGEHCAILGPNGCGKSTLIKLITRELYPLARTDDIAPVRLLGRERWQLTQLRAQLGIVSADLGADLNQMPGLTVEDAVLSGLFASFVVPPQQQVSTAMRERAREALAQIDALPLLARAYAELSAGQARRVLIARALVNRPRALLLDEPSTGLDLIARQRLLDSLRQLARRGITLILVTHHIEEIVPEIGRVILLREGRVLADGERAALLTDDHLSALFDGPVQVHHADGRYHASVLS